MSVCIYAGSTQFVAISIMSAPFAPLSAFFMTIMVNARHLFYGLSMLEPFQNMGRLKPYLIFSLTDETYSLLCSVKVPDGVDRKWFLFFISLLDQLYWITGSCIGITLARLLLTPPAVRYLGAVLPFAVIAMLVVYCFKNVSVFSGSHGLPELIASAFVIVVHKRRRNLLLSIAGGTLVYMVLVQIIFPA